MTMMTMMWNIKQDIISNRLRFQSLLVSFFAIIAKTEATCNEEQVNSCRQAALSDRLETLRSSGQCIAKQYTEFSHLCSVTNYLPTVDYCCCRHQRDMLLCCRYHQDWNRFRCQEADDVISMRVGQKGALVDLPPLEILLPSTLIPLILIVIFCLLCVVSCCWCQRRRRKKTDDELRGGERGRGCCRCWFNLLIRCSRCPVFRGRETPTQRSSSDMAATGSDPSRSMSPDEETWTTTAPLNRIDPSEHLHPLPASAVHLNDESIRYPCFYYDDCTAIHCPNLHRVHPTGPPPPCIGGGRGAVVEPSAPPASEASIPVASHQDHCSCVCAGRTCMETNAGAELEGLRGGGPGGHAVLCPVCASLQPPPAYEESWNHRIV